MIIKTIAESLWDKKNVTYTEKEVESYIVKNYQLLKKKAGYRTSCRYFHNFFPETVTFKMEYLRQKFLQKLLTMLGDSFV